VGGGLKNIKYNIKTEKRPWPPGWLMPRETLLAFGRGLKVTKNKKRRVRD
jgi:hypothetical protein